MLLAPVLTRAPRLALTPKAIITVSASFIGRLLNSSKSNKSAAAAVMRALSASALRQRGSQILAVHAGDGLDADFLGAHRFAFAFVRAAAEALGVHARHHREDAAVAFDLALRQEAEVGDF